VGVVDDHEMFRAGVISTISNDFDVVGQSADVFSSVQMITELKPDVVLLDVHVPGGDGGGGAEIIMRSMPYSPKTFFLALSVSDSAVDVGAVIRAGARGYVTKTITAADLISSIQQVADGYAVFSPKLAGFVLSAFNGQGSAGRSQGDGAMAEPYGAYNPVGNVSDDAADNIDVLTPREQEVMRLIARGYSYKEVASELFISIKTVETHVSAVLRKLQLSNRAELARWAAKRRII
jgi:DNA-binding NarL/FixJ family response regulator